MDDERLRLEFALRYWRITRARLDREKRRSRTGFVHRLPRDSGCPP
jgi:hypothetical protein